MTTERPNGPSIFPECLCGSTGAPHWQHDLLCPGRSRDAEPCPLCAATLTHMDEHGEGICAPGRNPAMFTRCSTCGVLGPMVPRCSTCLPDAWRRREVDILTEALRDIRDNGTYVSASDCRAVAGKTLFQAARYHDESCRCAHCADREHI